MGEEEKKKFLVFLTGSSRVPIGGLEVNIKFVNVSPEHLPVAHTCFNLLDLPVSLSFFSDQVCNNIFSSLIRVQRRP